MRQPVRTGREQEEATRLQGKTALVTGATSGIGAAIAHAFAGKGAQVVITGRNAHRGQVVVETIGAAGGAARCVVADLTSRMGIDHLVSETHTAVGRIDFLVNNVLPDRRRCPTDGCARVRQNH